MKNSLLLVCFILVFIGCSNNDEYNKFGDAMLPPSSQEYPLIANAPIKILHDSFQQEDIIILKGYTIDGTPIKIEPSVVDITSSYLTFIAPEVLGAYDLFVAHKDKEEHLGKLYFNDGSTRKLIKEIEVLTKDLTFHFEYDEYNRLNKLTEVNIKDHKGFIFNLEYDVTHLKKRVEQAIVSTKHPTALISKTLFHNSDSLITAEQTFYDESWPKKNYSIILNNDSSIKSIENEECNKIFSYNTDKILTRILSTHNTNKQDISIFYDSNSIGWNKYISMPSWIQLSELDFKESVLNYSLKHNPNKLKISKDGGIITKTYRYILDKENYPIEIIDTTEGREVTIALFKYSEL